MKLTTKTIKRGNTWKTEYRIDSVYIETYGKVTEVIDELMSVVHVFPESLQSEVTMDMEPDNRYATFTVEGLAPKEDVDKAKAKEKKTQTDWLNRALKEKARLEAQIKKVEKEIG